MALALQNSLRRIARLSGPHACRMFHDEFRSPNPPAVKKLSQDPSETRVPAAGSIANKYQVFRDVDATVILDVEEERQLQLQQNLDGEAEPEEPQPNNALPSVFNGINLERGKTGVYDIDDLEIKYVDYICVVTGMSFRHMRGIAEFVRKIFKMKRNPTDIIPKIEGENSRDWMALDLGNIALHIFSEQAREQYDLESLWAVGAKYDRECNKPAEPLVELFERHSVYLNDLKPLKKEMTDADQTLT